MRFVLSIKLIDSDLYFVKQAPGGRFLKNPRSRYQPTPTTGVTVDLGSFLKTWRKF